MKPIIFSIVIFGIFVTGEPSAWALAKRPPVVVQVSQIEVTTPVDEIPALELSDMIKEALAKNPELRAFKERWKAARARVWQALSWDDTMVGVDFEGIPRGRVDADRAMNTEWMISQKIPFPGKRFLKGRVASKEAKMAEADYRAKEREIISEVKKAYIEYALRENEYQNHTETKQALERLSESAESRYATGKISYPEVLKIQTELAKIVNDIAKHHQQIQTALARLNMLMGRTIDEPLRIESLKPERTFSYSREELMKLAIESRSELRAMHFGVEAAKTDAKSAWLDLMPDGEFRIEARRFSGEGKIREYDQFFGFQIPVFSLFQRTGAIREKQAQKRAADGAWEHMRNLVLFEVQEALAEFESNDRTVQIYESSVLPQARASFDSALASYEGGSGNFISVMEAQKVLTEFRHEYFHSVAMREESFAELERVVGVDLRGGMIR